MTRHSVTSWVGFLGSSPISCKTRKQHIVSRFSVEAEYHSKADVKAKLKWLHTLLTDLGVSHSQPISLFCDSKSALYITLNPVFHERTKHIKVDCHYIHDAIQDGLISIAYVPTTEQFVDCFTKAPGVRQFRILLGSLGIGDHHAPT